MVVIVAAAPEKHDASHVGGVAAPGGRGPTVEAYCGLPGDFHRALNPR